MKSSSEFETLIQNLCEEHEVPLDLFQEMLSEERRVRHLKRRRGITDRLRQMITESLEAEE